MEQKKIDEIVVKVHQHRLSKYKVRSVLGKKDKKYGWVEVKVCMCVRVCVYMHTQIDYKMFLVTPCRCCNLCNEHTQTSKMSLYWCRCGCLARRRLCLNHMVLSSLPHLL